MRTKVFYNLPESACYGCHACASVCPVKAIEMIPDKEGFLFPTIDPDKCIECGLCERTCPTQEEVFDSLINLTPETVDASWEKDFDSRLSSTSGGVFYILAKKWIDNGGVVYGAAFDGQLRVKHVRTHNLEALKNLRGSKYVQSDLSELFPIIKKDLANGLNVLFSGTPCQVGGLRAFLKKEYDNLLTVDLVCHGVPSPMMFSCHIGYIEKLYNKKLVDYKFRYKKMTGWRAYIRYVFSDGTSDVVPLGKDFFAYCFYNSKINRQSCSVCRYSQSKRTGDITLSDFWNSEKESVVLKRQRKYGYNMVMCNTKKGIESYVGIKDELEHLSLPVKVALEGDVRLRHPEDAPTDREFFFKDCLTYGYEWLANNRFPKSPIVSRIVPVWAKNLVAELKSRL